MTHSPFRTARPRAFTLIELLTVIAIIGILAAILIPTISKVRQGAKNARCVASLREWGRVIMFHANDNKGFYTLEGRNGRPWYDAGTSPYTQYFQQSGMTATRTVRACPLAPSSTEAVTKTDYFICRGSVNGAINSFATPTDKIPLHKARNPSQLILMLDGVENGQDATFYVSSDQNRIRGHVLPMFTGNAVNGDFRESAGRHGGRNINGVFADGSVKRITGTPLGQGDKYSIQEMRTVWFQIY